MYSWKWNRNEEKQHALFTAIFFLIKDFPKCQQTLPVLIHLIVFCLVYLTSFSLCNNTTYWRNINELYLQVFFRVCVSVIIHNLLYTVLLSPQGVFKISTRRSMTLLYKNRWTKSVLIRTKVGLWRFIFNDQRPNDIKSRLVFDQYNKKYISI